MLQFEKKQSKINAIYLFIYFKIKFINIRILLLNIVIFFNKLIYNYTPK